jgi:hypothetical protein
MKLFSVFFFEKLELLVIPGINLYPIVGINLYPIVYTCMMYDCNIAINIYSSRCANGLSERSLGKNLPMTYGRVVWSMLGIMIITLW